MNNKKKGFKEYIPIVMVVVLLLACVVGFNIFSNNSLAKEASQRLKGRYNEDFTILKVYPRGFGALYYTVVAYPNNNPDCVFEANIDTKDEGFSDSYVERYICQQIAEQIYANLDMGDDVFIHVATSKFSPITYDLNQTIEEYSMLDGPNSFATRIFTTNEVEKLYDWDTLFANLEYLDISARIYTLNDDNSVQKIRKYFHGNPHGGRNVDFQLTVKHTSYEEVYR